jgi:hypothetical protein
MPYKDTEYLSYFMSSDAAPVLITNAALKQYPDYVMYHTGISEKGTDTVKWRCLYISRIDASVSDTGWRNWNLSRYIAKSMIGEYAMPN